MTDQMINRHNLINLLKQNPDVPIMANVYSEVVQDDGWAFWYGDVKEESYYVDSLWAGKRKIWSLDDALDDMMIFFEFEFPEDLTVDVFSSDEEISKWNEKAEKLIRSLPWKKYIVLNVDTPDILEGGQING